METNPTQGSIFNFSVDDEARNQLKEVSRWARINALLAFATMGLSVVTIIISARNIGGYYAGELVGKQLVSWIISVVLNVILYNSSVSLQKALLNTNQQLFNKGLLQMATYFKVVGIILIVMLSLVLVGVLAALLF